MAKFEFNDNELRQPQSMARYRYCGTSYAIAARRIADPVDMPREGLVALILVGNDGEQ